MEFPLAKTKHISAIAPFDNIAHPTEKLPVLGAAQADHRMHDEYTAALKKFNAQDQLPF